MDDGAQLCIFFHRPNVAPIVELSSLTGEERLRFGKMYVIRKVIVWHQVQRVFSWCDMALLS
jgi:hypothetical protein